MNFNSFELTWLASVLCAVGASYIALSALRQREHWVVVHPLFLPLYFSGILQWVYWGIRIADPGLIYPSLIQLVLLSPSLYRWYLRRVV